MPLGKNRLYSLPSEDAEKPFGHVQDGFYALLLQMPINFRAGLFQKAKENVPVELNGFHASTVVALDVLFTDIYQTPERLL